MFLFPLDKYPGVKLLDYMVVLFLNFWGISILFSTVAVKTYIPTNGVPGFPLSTVSFPWSLVMLSIFPCALFSCVCLLWISVYSNPLPLLNKDVWFFFNFLMLSSMSSLYILNFNLLWDIPLPNIFSHLVRISFCW